MTQNEFKNILIFPKIKIPLKGTILLEKSLLLNEVYLNMVKIKKLDNLTIANILNNTTVLLFSDKTLVEQKYISKLLNINLLNINLIIKNINIILIKDSNLLITQNKFDLLVNISNKYAELGNDLLGLNNTRNKYYIYNINTINKNQLSKINYYQKYYNKKYLKDSILINKIITRIGIIYDLLSHY